MTIIYKILFVIFATSSVWAQSYEGEIKPFEVRTGYIFSSENYSLAGTGFTAATGSVVGSSGSVAFRWNRPEATYHLEYFSQTQKPDAPTGLLPQTVTSQLSRTLLTLEPKNKDMYSSTQKGIRWNYSLDFRQRSATNTSPNIYVPSSTSMGLRFGGASTFEWKQDISIEAGAGIYVPLYRDEQSSKTGYYVFSLNPDINLDLIYRVNQRFSLSTGIRLLYERVKYSGTGERGTANAEETYTDIYLPLELRFAF